VPALIEHINASDAPVSQGWDEVQHWQDGILEYLLIAGLLSKDVKSQSLACTGGEQNCFMPDYQTDDGQRAFIVCDAPDKQEQMGRWREGLTFDGIELCHGKKVPRIGRLVQRKFNLTHSPGLRSFENKF
jgi:hypothetical protein